MSTDTLVYPAAPDIQAASITTTETGPAHVRILVVDDDETVRGTIKRVLMSTGYQCEEADSGVMALKVLTNDHDLVLTDLRMPGMDGLGLLKQIRTIQPDTAVILISGYGDIPEVIECMRAGAYDYITKPVDIDVIINRVQYALVRRRQKMLDRVYKQQLENLVGEQQRRIALTLGELWQTYHETLDALTAALDMRDKETEGHSRRVTEYTTIIARTLGITGDALDIIRQGALLHDIGKIGVPDAILHKPGPLTDIEWVAMRQHPQIGYDVLKNIDFLREPVSTIVLHHHEWFDGTGYPHRLAGLAIPLGARIFSVADALDALISDRVYRPGKPIEAAQAEIMRMSGTQFDPEVVSAFLSIPNEAWQAIQSAVAILSPRL